jgi:hypothetical protein
LEARSLLPSRGHERLESRIEGGHPLGIARGQAQISFVLPAENLEPHAKTTGSVPIFGMTQKILGSLKLLLEAQGRREVANGALFGLGQVTLLAGHSGRPEQRVTGTDAAHESALGPTPRLAKLFLGHSNRRGVAS